MLLSATPDLFPFASHEVVNKVLVSCLIFVFVQMLFSIELHFLNYIFLFLKQQALRSLLLATKASNDLPNAGDDFDYYSSFEGFRDVMDIEGKRILEV